MLVRGGRRAAHPSRGQGQPGVDSRLQHLTVDGVFNLHHHLRLPGVGVVEPLLAGAAHRTFAARLGDEVFPLLGGASAEKLLNALLRFGAETGAVQGTVEVGQSIGVPGGDAGGLDELAEVLVAGTAETHPLTVTALENATPQLLKRRNRWRGVVYPHPEASDGLEHAVEQGHLDALPHAVALPGVQGNDDSNHRLECAIDRRDGDGGVNGPRAGAVGRAHGGRCRRDNPFEGWHGGPRVVGGEPGNRAKHQPGVGLNHGLGPQSQPVHDAGPEVLHHHIGAVD